MGEGRGHYAHNQELFLQVAVVTCVEGSAKVTRIGEILFRGMRKGTYLWQPELNGEHWHAHVYIDVCFPGIWSLGPERGPCILVVGSGRLLHLCTDNQKV